MTGEVRELLFLRELGMFFKWEAVAAQAWNPLGRRLSTVTLRCTQAAVPTFVASGTGAPRRI